MENCFRGQIHVNMPWQDKSDIYDPESNNFHNRWDLIKNNLQDSFSNSAELIDAIKSYSVYYDNNGVQKPTKFNFGSLQAVIDSMGDDELAAFFSEGGILNYIRDLVLKSPNSIPEIIWLPAGEPGTQHLSQEQVAQILANAFFCTFPIRRKNQPSINFLRLFDYNEANRTRELRKIEKIRCILHYFYRIQQKQPSGKISYCRRCIRQKDYPRWDKASSTLTTLTVESDGRIEEKTGYLQMDFANRVIGGGVLDTGCVQEEIRFIICPELIAARLFCEPMADNEAIIIIGAERYCQYTGYADTFEYSGDYTDPTPLDEKNRRSIHILAVDALYFSKPQEQYRESMMLRELKKIYTGLKSEEKSPRPLATGNWGCGAFRGDPQLKSLLQLIAASEARRSVLYLTFSDEKLKDDLTELYSLMQKRGINNGYLYRILTRYNRDRRKGQTVFEFVSRALQGKAPDYSQIFSLPTISDKLAALESGQTRAQHSPLTRNNDSSSSAASQKLWVETEKTKPSISRLHSSSHPSFKPKPLKIKNITHDMFEFSDEEDSPWFIPATPQDEIPSSFPQDDNSPNFISATPEKVNDSAKPVINRKTTLANPVPQPVIFETLDEPMAGTSSMDAVNSKPGFVDTTGKKSANPVPQPVIFETLDEPMAGAPSMAAINSKPDLLDTAGKNLALETPGSTSVIFESSEERFSSVNSSQSKYFKPKSGNVEKIFPPQGEGSTRKSESAPVIFETLEEPMSLEVEALAPKPNERLEKSTECSPQRNASATEETSSTSMDCVPDDRPISPEMKCKALGIPSSKGIRDDKRRLSQPKIDLFFQRVRPK